MKLEEILRIVQTVTYKPGWTIHAEISKRGFVEVQIGVDDTTEASIDAQKRDGTRTPWKGGKKYLHEHMCYQEIVGACFGMIEDAEIHEMREWFRLAGRAIYNPHIDPRVLWRVAGKAQNFNVRDNAMAMDNETLGAAAE